jgi:hypothetical protein
MATAAGVMIPSPAAAPVDWQEQLTVVPVDLAVPVVPVQVALAGWLMAPAVLVAWLMAPAVLVAWLMVPVVLVAWLMVPVVLVAWLMAPAERVVWPMAVQPLLALQTA